MQIKETENIGMHAYGLNIFGLYLDYGGQITLLWAKAVSGKHCSQLLLQLSLQE